MLQRDYERHRVWLVVDTLLLTGIDCAHSAAGPQHHRLLLCVSCDGSLAVDPRRASGPAWVDVGRDNRAEAADRS
jgi:hypothetical protein